MDDTKQKAKSLNLYKWILMILWPILMLMGLFFMVNFTFEPLGLYGLIMLALGFITASVFIFGKVNN